MSETSLVAKPTLAAGGTVAAIIPHTIEECHRLAVAITQADVAPRSYKRDANKVMIAIMQGMEVGYTPMVALQSIAIINGVPCIYGDGAIGLVHGSGLLEDMSETAITKDGEVVGFRCILKRRDKPTPIEQTFTLLDAEKAGLLRKPGTWQEYPQRMLQMRARSWALRDGFADVLKGLAIREEVEDMGPPLVQAQDGVYEPTRSDPKENEVLARAVDLADAQGISTEEALEEAREERAEEAGQSEVDTFGLEDIPWYRQDTMPEKPDAIPVPVKEDGSGSDWTAWLGDLKHVIGRAPSAAWLTDLEALNTPALDNLESAGPKGKAAAEAVRAHFVECRTALESTE